MDSDEKLKRGNILSYYFAQKLQIEQEEPMPNAIIVKTIRFDVYRSRS